MISSLYHRLHYYRFHYYDYYYHHCYYNHYPAWKNSPALTLKIKNLTALTFWCWGSPGEIPLLQSWQMIKIGWSFCISPNIFHATEVHWKLSALLHALLCSLHARGPFSLHGLTLIQAWISNYIHHKVWDKLTYQFPNFNRSTVVGILLLIHAGIKVKLC